MEPPCATCWCCGRWWPLLVVVYPLWKIGAKTGNPAALSLLFFIPVANLILVWFLALSRWPALGRKLPASPGQSRQFDPRWLRFRAATFHHQGADGGSPWCRRHLALRRRG